MAGPRRVQAGGQGLRAPDALDALDQDKVAMKLSSAAITASG